MARPPSESDKIDRTELEKLLKLHPSEQEAADWFDVQTKTLIRYIKKHFGCSFVQLREKNFVRTKIAIKRTQIEKALKGDNTMLIWCGKQHLKQSDKTAHELSGPDGGPIESVNKADLSDEALEARFSQLLDLLKLTPQKR